VLQQGGDILLHVVRARAFPKGRRTLVVMLQCGVGNGSKLLAIKIKF
jgi:hypothetical protein